MSIWFDMPQNSGNIRHGVLWLRSHLLKPNLSPAPAASPITSLLFKKKVFRGDKELLGPWVSTNFPFFGFSKKDEIEWSAVRTTQLCNRAPSLSLQALLQSWRPLIASQDILQIMVVPIECFPLLGSKVEVTSNICVDLRSSKKRVCEPCQNAALLKFYIGGSA